MAKQIPGDRLKQIGDELLVPGVDVDNVLRCVERIDAGGKKLSLGEKKYRFFPARPIDGDLPFVLCEGSATALSVSEIAPAGYNVLGCFGAGNMKNVLQALREKYPGATFYTATDGDSSGEKAAASCEAQGAKRIPFPSGEKDGADWNDLVIRYGAAGARRMFEGALPKERNRDFDFLDADYLEPRPPQWIVRNFIEKDVLGSFFGASESGKSFLAIDLSLCVASGAPFAGCSVVQEGLVCYIAGEGASGIKNRLAAWCKSRDIPRKGLPFVLSNQSADILDDASVRKIIDRAEAAAERHGVQPVLFVIDTLSRNFGAGDENSSQDMKVFIDGMDALRLHFPGSAVLCVHHSGHADRGRARGSTVFRAAMDSEYMIERDGQTVIVKHTKGKDAPRREDIFFEFEDVPLGETEDGEPFGSAVLRPTDEAPQKENSLPKQQQIALQAFREAVEDFGQVDRLGRFKGVQVSDWKDVFCDSREGAKGTKVKAFDRASEALVERRYVKIEGDWATFAGSMAEFFSNEAAKKIISREDESQKSGDDIQSDILDMSKTNTECLTLDRHRQGLIKPLSVQMSVQDCPSENQNQNQSKNPRNRTPKQKILDNLRQKAPGCIVSVASVTCASVNNRSLVERTLFDLAAAGDLEYVDDGESGRNPTYRIPPLGEEDFEAGA